MGGRGNSSGLSGGSVTPQAAAAAPQPVPTPAPAPAKPTTPQPAPVTYGRLPMSQAQYMASQPAWSAATQSAVADYLYPHATGGSLYSPSQQLNNALRKGLPLTAAQRRIMAGMDAAMHPLGYDLNLTRYDRVGYVARLLGGADYTTMTEAQVRRRLIGQTYTDDAFVSTSCDRFRNAPAGNAFTDKAVEVRVHAKKTAKAMMPGDGAGGRLGEIVLGRGQQYRIVDVKMPQGQTGRSGANYYQKIIITVEVG